MAYRILGIRAFWKDGIHLEGPQEKIKIRIGVSAKFDAGRLDADDQLGRAFPDFVGQTTNLRSLRGNFLTTFFDTMDWRLVFEFANQQQIKENSFGLTGKIPFLGYVRAGYMKEPFSLEELTGWTHFTFMEKALPTWTFAPGSNLGIRMQNAAWDDRLTWSLGGFWNVQSAENVGDARDQIDQANGYDLTMRLTGLPWYEEDGRSLLHLGLGYSHRFPSGGSQNVELKYATRPETYLISDNLVNTEKFSVTQIDLFNLEMAAVFGPLSYQAEGFYSIPAGASGETYHFWGAYGFGSYFLTGENRPYNKREGLFSGIKPKHDFRPLEGKWGAWELAVRYSYIDLNDRNIQGGKEGNFTMGLNWYFNSYLQVMFNYIQARVDDRGSSPRIGSGKADIFQTRFQVAF